MRFAQHSLSASMFSIAGGMCSASSIPISIQRNFQSYGHLSNWVCITNSNEFNSCWTQIKEDTEVPKSMAEYIAREWLSHKDMWSAVSRQNRTIFEEGDTNML